MTHKEFIRHTNGDRVVMFIHGFLGSPNHFEEFIKLVPEQYGIYNVLLCGHGGTVNDFSKASMSIWKEQIGQIVKDLCERYKEIIIVAHSMGTLFAYSAALQYPQSIKSMLLLGTPLTIYVKWTAVHNSCKSLFGKISDEDEVAKAYATTHSIKLTRKLWEYIGWVPRYLELFRESKKWRRDICRVEVPSFIFQSANDELVSRKSEKFIPQKDNFSLTVLKNSAHFIYDEEDMKHTLDTFVELIGG